MKKLRLFPVLSFLILIIPFVANAQLNRIDSAFISKDLSGFVLAPNEDPLVGCEVERRSTAWAKVIEITTTNEIGKFKFPKKVLGTYFLKISCQEFQSYEIKVLTSRKSKNIIKLKLQLAI